MLHQGSFLRWAPTVLCEMNMNTLLEVMIAIIDVDPFYFSYYNDPDHLHRMNTFIEHSFTATMVCVLKNSAFSEEDIWKLEHIRQKGSKYFPAVVKILEGYNS